MKCNDHPGGTIRETLDGYALCSACRRYLGVCAKKQPTRSYQVAVFGHSKMPRGMSWIQRAAARPHRRGFDSQSVRDFKN